MSINRHHWPYVYPTENRQQIPNRICATVSGNTTIDLDLDRESEYTRWTMEKDPEIRDGKGRGEPGIVLTVSGDRFVVPDEIRFVVADLLHVTAGKPDDDSNDESGDDGEHTDDSCHCEARHASNEDSDEDRSHPSSDSVEVVDTHHIQHSDLLAEPRLQVDEAECGDGSCDETDDEGSPGSDGQQG